MRILRPLAGATPRSCTNCLLQQGKSYARFYPGTRGWQALSFWEPSPNFRFSLLFRLQVHPLVPASVPVSPRPSFMVISQ